MSEHARINHSSVREICLAILQFVLQIDFRQKFMQYVKKINETLSVHQEHRLSRIEMYEIEFLFSKGFTIEFYYFCIKF